MISVAFKMLIGNRAALIGVIFGIFLSILLISQQSAIYLGLISRSYRIVTTFSEPDVWVIDPATRDENLIRPMPKEYLQYVKSIPNIEWAVPINYLLSQVSTESGVFTTAEIYGIDNQTLVGLPQLQEGNIQDLYREGGLIIDARSAGDLLATTLPNGEKRPLKPGDRLEIHGHSAFVAGIAKVPPGFLPQPTIFMLNEEVYRFSGTNRIQFIAARKQSKADLNDILYQINLNNNVLGLTSDQLKSRMAEHFLKTGILINYGISLLLGVIIGFSIAGQIFYIMTLHNLSYYALIKALGGTEKMIFFQAVVVGLIGYLFGTAAALLWGFLTRHTTLAFEYPWQLLIFTGGFAVLICVFIAFLSIRKVFKTDPHTLMTNA